MLYAASLGLSIVIGNWVVTLLHRHGGLSKSSAGLVGALTLMLGIVTRPLGGWILHERPRRDARRRRREPRRGRGRNGGARDRRAGADRRSSERRSSGSPRGFRSRPPFTGAALTRPDAPAAAVGFVNGAAAFVTLVGHAARRA